MGQHHDKTFPNENNAYRQARDALLTAEMALRRQHAEVCVLRQNLPLGGAVSQDYEFDEQDGGKRRLSDLFVKKDKPLVVYSFMYADREDATPCSSCSSLLDGLNGAAPHIMDNINFAVVGKADTDVLESWRNQQGWHKLMILSSKNNSYNADYFAETPEGNQIPAVNVFELSGDEIHHTYNTELLYSPSEEGQHPRHVDALWPVWNMFDMTRLGRGDWGPRLGY